MQSLISGGSGFLISNSVIVSFCSNTSKHGQSLERGLAGSAGVPSPDIGLKVPLGGTGILMSSGEPGTISGATPGMKMRLASFW